MIRQITRTDIPACVDVIRSSFMTVAEQFGFTAQNAPRFTAFATSEERLLFQLENERRCMYAYCLDDGRIVAYYSLLMQDDGECELGNLCVLPQYRHRHIGEELLADACRRAVGHGCKRINISIVEENTLLRTWYELHGFVHTHCEKFDFFPFTCGYMQKEL